MSPVAPAPARPHPAADAVDEVAVPREPRRDDDRGLVGSALVVVAAALWGCWSLAFKNAERLSPSLSAATESAVVFVVMLVTMVPLAVVTRRRAVAAGQASSTTRPASAWALLLALGVSDAGNALCFFGAMQKTSVAVAVLSHYLTPLFVAALSPWVLGEPARRSTWGALGLALSGLVLLLRPWSAAGADDVVGALLGASSAVFYAVNVFGSKRLEDRFDAVEIASWPKLTSSIALSVVAVVALVGGDGAWPSAAALAVLVVGGLLCGAVPTVLFYAGLRRVQASQASVLTLVEPFVAVVLGVVVWGEALHTTGVVGGACVLAAAAWIARAGRR
jgi:drug/metabolite transporter (DMT)-like permease